MSGLTHPSFKRTDFNQYQFIHEITNFMRTNSNSPIVIKLKQCKTQAEMNLVYERDVLKKRIPENMQ